MQSTKRDETSKRQQALQQAMLTFWQKGVNDTSYPDLVDTTGLSRKSLYGFWPEKSALILDSLKAYDQQVLTPLRDLLLPPGRAALETFWSRLEDGLSQPGWNGCLLFRSASGDMRGDKDVAQLLDGHLNLLSHRFRDAVMAAQHAGQIGTEIDADRAAIQVCGLAVYISVIGSNEGYSDRAKAIVAEGKRCCGLS